MSELGAESLDHVVAEGDPADPTVVFIHGAGATRRIWRPHMDRLGSGCRLVSADLPGHGRHPEASFSYAAAVESIADILAAEGPAVLVGHSAGGYVAMMTAREHPDRVQGVVIAGADYNWRKPKGILIGLLSYPMSGLYRAIALSERLTEAFRKRGAAGLEDRQYTIGAAGEHNPVRGLAAVARATRFLDSWGIATDLEQPMLIVHGDDEALRGHAEELVGRLDSATLEFIDGGHNAAVVHPEPFVELVAEFLAEIGWGDHLTEAQPNPSP